MEKLTRQGYKMMDNIKIWTELCLARYTVKTQDKVSLRAISVSL